MYHLCTLVGSSDYIVSHMPFSHWCKEIVKEGLLAFLLKSETKFVSTNNGGIAGILLQSKWFVIVH